MPKIDTHCLMFGEGSRHAFYTAQALIVKVNIFAIRCPGVFSSEHQYVSPGCVNPGRMRNSDNIRLTTPTAPKPQRIKPLLRRATHFITVHPSRGFPCDAVFSSNQRSVREICVPKNIMRDPF